MGYQSTHPGYTVRVDGIGLGRSRFAIQATVDYEPQLEGHERERVVSQAQMELVLAVVGEWERATRLGASNIRIAVLGDGQLDRFFRNWMNGQSPNGLGPRRSTAGAGRPQLQTRLTPE